MGIVRTLIRDHRRLALLLIVLTLGLRALVPAGYMVGTSARVLTIEICADTQGAHLTRQIVIPQRGAADHGASLHDKAQGGCPWSGLTMPSLGGADAPLLAAALAFVLALGFAAPRSPPAPRRTFVRPPLRGPPLTA